MIGSRFFGVSWFGTQTIASAVFGLPVGFLTIWIVSLLTEAPPKQVQDLVASVSAIRRPGRLSLAIRWAVICRSGAH